MRCDKLFNVVDSNKADNSNSTVKLVGVIRYNFRF